MSKAAEFSDPIKDTVQTCITKAKTYRKMAST